MIDLKKLTDSVAVVLQDKQPPTEKALRDIVKAQAAVLAMMAGHSPENALSDSDIDSVVKTIETRFSIRMEIGSIFESKNYRPWLAERQKSITWYYWERFRKHLFNKSYPPHVVTTLDQLTDKVLDHLEDPTKEGRWQMKGLVVGHVQSGKTGNYTGLVCKAADAGYRVIIILAGTLNSLRNQTQERIDADFIGWCTREKKPIGANAFGSGRRPVCFTTSVEDFKKQAANTIAMNLAALNEPVVLILKKNKSTLQNLIEWLSDNNRYDLKNFPMLLIDDEADYASINTKREEDSPAAINFSIRNLLSLFTRTSFIGYTATPFANIFIDPETEEEMENGDLYKDLFPKDFILSLDPPDNYVGPSQLFSDEANLNCVRLIEDSEPSLPIQHQIDFSPEVLPESLKNAIKAFILGKALRILRGHEKQNHSMLVNASRFTKVQKILGNLIFEYVRQLKKSIANYSGLQSEEALQNKDLADLKIVFDDEFSHSGFSWQDIQKKLKESADPIEVLIINADSSDTLDYRKSNYPNGRTVLAVGGIGLSRGLTLEGLLTSYFLRNSVMYDTLMQMGRWFGYRDGYADLCRIFMTSDASSWYSHIADATEELRRDFKDMERAKLTPKDFGLRVRSHPTALMVTARNKMRTGRTVPIQISLQGRLVSTSILLNDTKSLIENKKVLEKVILACENLKPSEKHTLGYLWKSIPASIVQSMVSSYVNHPECLLTGKDPLLNFIDNLRRQGKGAFDVLLRSKEGSREDEDFKVGTLNIYPISRELEKNSSNKLAFNKRRVGSRGDERAGLSENEVKQVEARFPKSANISDREYRKFPDRNPLLIIYFVKVKEPNKQESMIVPAYALSFPGDSGAKARPESLVEYVVNTKWWQDNYGIYEEEEQES